MADFERALQEVVPAFGNNNNVLENKLLGGMHSYGYRFDKCINKCKDFINEIKESENTQLLTLLLEGESGSGKTAIAAKLALESGFPFVKLISPENYVGFSEHAKISSMVKIFEDAYKSSLSLIILDDIERLIEFIHIGPRFSNPILQALLVLIKKTPPNQNRKLMIIGTTSMKSIMQKMDLVDVFNTCLSVPCLDNQDEVESLLQQFSAEPDMIAQVSKWIQENYEKGVPIKNMMLAIDIAKQKTSGKLESFSHFTDSLESIQSTFKLSGSLDY